MAQLHDDDRETPRDPDETRNGLPEEEPGEYPNFESRVNEFSEDSDEQFDEDLHPDRKRGSER